MRQLAYVFGALMIARGLILSFNPQLWRTAWQRYSRPYLPGPVNRMAAEYAALSDQSLSILGVWTALMGALLVALAAQSRD